MCGLSHKLMKRLFSSCSVQIVVWPEISDFTAAILKYCDVVLELELKTVEYSFIQQLQMNCFIFKNIRKELQ